MINNIISFDEAGNTGQDLLHDDQKVFVLASNNFSDDEIRILKSLFATDRELHFKKLKDSAPGRKAIIDFLNHDLIGEKNIICLTAHKEFVVVGQIIDKLAEPVLYDMGIDLYKFGQNITYNNYLFYLGNFKWDKKLFNEVLESFIKND